MDSLNRENTVGNWGTLLLPINSDDSIDWNRLSDEIDVLIEAKVNGIYSNGTAGEFHTQTEDEFDKVNFILAEKCERAQMPFQIGASHMSPQISIERIKRVKSLKPGAFQVILSDWFPLNDIEVINFLHKIADEAVDIGIVLYNPPHAKRILSPEMLYHIGKEESRVIGVKLADGDRTWYENMKDVFKKLSIFVPGHHLATGFKYGAKGAYSNVACLSPKGAQNWYEMMKTDINSALELEGRIQEFMSKYISPYISNRKYMNGAADKLLAAIGNWANVGTRLRWPYSWIPEEEATALRKVTKEILPEMFI